MPTASASSCGRRWPVEPDVDRPSRRAMASDTAGFGQRLLARVVDGLILLAPNLLLYAALDGFAAVAAIGALDLLYEIPQLARWGQTVGKRALGIRVVTVDGGLPPTPAQAFVRVVVPQVLFFSPSDTIAAVGPFWALAVYLPVFFEPMRRGLHDRAAGTRVVRDA